MRHTGTRHAVAREGGVSKLTGTRRLSKKPTTKKKSPKSPQPLPAQLEAIGKLLDAGNYTAALGKLTPLIRRFPDHAGLRRASIEALSHTEGPRHACVAAFEWAESRPRSLPAQEALLRYAAPLGYLLLAERTACRVRELGGQTPGFPLAPELIESFLETPDGTRTSAEMLERFDIGKMYMDGLAFAAALRHFEGLDILGAINNRAITLFHLGRIDEAADVLTANWSADAGNLLSLGWLVRLRLYRGDETGALGLCTPLAAATARRGEDALGQLSALLLMQLDQAAWEAFERIRACDWFTAPLGPVEGAMLRHFGACAASRLGRLDEARALWRQATALHRDLRLPRENLRVIEGDTRAAEYPMIFDVPATLPLEVTRRLQAGSTDLVAELAALTAADTYLTRAYLVGDQTMRGLLGIVLGHRAGQGDTEAAAALRLFARLPIGTPQERMQLLQSLSTHGALAPDAMPEFWDGREVRQVKLISTKITREPLPTELSDAQLELLSKSIALFNQGLWDAAEAPLLELLRQVPTHHSAVGNLAAIKMVQGHREEAIAMYRDLIDKQPDYLIGRCSLANILIRDGDLDGAQHLLEGLAEREHLHIQEIFSLYGTHAYLLAARGDMESAKRFLDSLESMVEDDEDERRFQRILDLLRQYETGTNVGGLLSRLLGRPAKPGRRRT